MMRLTAILLAALAGAASVSTACAEDISVENNRAGGVRTFLQNQRVSGVLRTDYFRSSKTFDDETDFLGATAQIKALPRFSETVDGKLEARITNPAIGGGGETRSRLLEGYVTAHFEKVDLRIGKQIVAWGRADGINPTDNLTPRDFTLLLPFEDDQRFGTTAVRLDTFLSQEHTFTVFATPYFEPSKIPLRADGRTFVYATPPHTLSNTEIGLKLNKIGEGFDWSVSYFRGFSPLPNARPIESGPAGSILELHYDRITVLGADFARNFGRFGLRGEAAYVDTADDSGTDPSIKNPYLFWVIGVDRTFLDNLNVNLQFFQRWVRRYQNPESIAAPQLRSVAVLNAVIDGQRDRINNGISFRVSKKWFNDTLEAEIFTVINLTRNDSFWRPLLTYAFNDHWKGTIGAEFYSGAKATQFGGQKLNRGGFAELRYGF